MMIWLLITSTLLGTAGAGSWVTGPDGPVEGVIGDDLRLPCNVRSGESAVDDEVIWKRGDNIVHHYLRHTDRTDQQLPEYRGRTSLSREALQTGDATLTLTDLRLSDAGEYKCIVRAGTWYDDTTVTVEAIGSTPSVRADTLGDGRVRLQCESVGWSSEPQVMWLNSTGGELPGEAPFLRKLPSGISVISFITVEERHGSNFTCVVKSAAKREQTIKVPRISPKGHTEDCSSVRCLLSEQSDFETKRDHYGVTAVFGVACGVSFGVAFAVALLMGVKAALNAPNGGANLKEVRCVLEEQEVCVYRQGHLEVREGYKGAVRSRTHTLLSGGTCLTLTMTKETYGHPMNGSPDVEEGP